MLKNLVQYFCNKLKITKNYTRCRRCGKLLKTKESRRLGLGKCCYKKEVQTKYTKPLF